MGKTLQELADYLGGRVSGDATVVINGLGTLDDAGEGQITFLANPRYAAKVATTRAEAVILPQGAENHGRNAIEVANPYLAFAAMLMAGLDGIKNKLDPGSAIDKDLYDLPPAELKKIPTVCGSLRQALGELDKDRDFLKAGGVFDDDFIDSYIDLKMQEVIRFEHTPHPVEYDMYYSA